MKKLRVQSTQVPWRIYAAYDAINFQGDPESGNVKIQLICHYSEKCMNQKREELKAIHGDELSDEQYNSIGHTVISLNFSGVPLFSQSNIIMGKELYDYRELEHWFKCSSDMFDEWNKTDICPVSGFYEVVDNDLKEVLGMNWQNLKHFSIITQSQYYNIFAKEFDWCEVNNM